MNVPDGTTGIHPTVLITMLPSLRRLLLFISFATQHGERKLSSIRSDFKTSNATGRLPVPQSPTVTSARTTFISVALDSAM